MTNEETLVREIRHAIKQMPDDSQIQVQVIAMTLRNILKQDPEHATMAFALVCAEQAEKEHGHV